MSGGGEREEEEEVAKSGGGRERSAGSRVGDARVLGHCAWSLPPLRDDLTQSRFPASTEPQSGAI